MIIDRSKIVLKPCPFCGGEAVIYACDETNWSAFVECSCCFIATRQHNTQKAVEVWNRRVQE